VFLARRRHRVFLILIGTPVLTACPRRAELPPPAPAKPSLSVLCRQQITAARLPAQLANPERGRWSVTLDVQGPVLAAHGARFRRKKIEPNGQAWSDVLEQCLTRWDPSALQGVQLDPEAGSLHAWVETEKDKDRWVAALCKAIDDPAWLDRCLFSVDRTRIDD
jgi:hypothetical protein